MFGFSNHCRNYLNRGLGFVLAWKNLGISHFASQAYQPNHGESGRQKLIDNNPRDATLHE